MRDIFIGSTQTGIAAEISHFSNNLDMSISPDSMREMACLDSGCTRHICKDEKCLTNLKRNNSSNPLGTMMTGDGSMSQPAGEGTMLVSSCLKCKNTWLIPSYKLNLISVSMLCNGDQNVLFTKKCATIYDDKGKVIAVAPQRNGLYLLPIGVDVAAPSISKKLTPIEFYHCLFGHVGERPYANCLRI